MEKHAWLQRRYVWKHTWQPKKKLLGHPFVTISNIYKYPVVKQHPLKCFPRTESSQKKALGMCCRTNLVEHDHLLPVHPLSRRDLVWRALVDASIFLWPALRLVVSPTIYRGSLLPKDWCRNSWKTSHRCHHFCHDASDPQRRKKTRRSVSGQQEIQGCLWCLWCYMMFNTKKPFRYMKNFHKT